MNYVTAYQLEPGDKVVVPKTKMKIIQHHAIILGKNYQGQDLIAENVAGQFVRVISAEEFFSQNQGITRIEKFPGNSDQLKAAIQRALEKLGQPYNLINFNCEHFANYVQTGESESSQVQWGIFVLIATVILIAAAE